MNKLLIISIVFTACLVNVECRIMNDEMKLLSKSFDEIFVKFDKLIKSYLTFSQNENVGINYKDCGSETGIIKSISVTDCPAVPCIFQRGKNYTLDLTFESNVDTDVVTNHVYGVIAKIPIPFNLPNENGCSLGVTCPVKKGDLLEEKVTLPILEQYPKVSFFKEFLFISKLILILFKNDS
jgi:hypothetical protein